MKLSIIIISTVLLFSCGGKSEKSDLDDKVELPDKMKEISGMSADGDDLWAITDKPHPVVYKLDTEGKVKQEVTVKNMQAIDVEAVTKDDGFVYIGDIGDNDGQRQDRQVIKVSKGAIGTEKKAEASGELITFRFSDQQNVDQKKLNNYDCESMLSMGDSLYLFTKRRGDFQTELFAIPKAPGNYVARSIGTFNSKGLVTDAAINKLNNEVALIGYNKGHRYPFILLFSRFQGNNFFSGRMQRIELADKPWDWQLESITYGNNDKVYFACEGTKQVKSTMYVIRRDKLQKLNKQK